MSLMEFVSNDTGLWAYEVSRMGACDFDKTISDEMVVRWIVDPAKSVYGTLLQRLGMDF